MTPLLAIGFWQSLWETIKGALLAWLKEAAEWIGQNAALHGKDIMDGFVSGLSWTGLDGHLSFFHSKVDAINFFFPVYESMGMLSWLCGLWGTMKTIRWIVSKLPFVGG